MKNSKKRRELFFAYFLSIALFAGGAPAANAGEISKKMKDAEKKVESSLDKEKVKEKVHETTEEFLSKEKINETVDRIADYFDTEKMKETVDQIAEYLDKEKIKQAIDVIAEYLDKEKVKTWIDLAAEYLDREKIKEDLDMWVDYVDKEKIKETLDEGIDRAADSLAKAADFVKKEVGEAKGDLASVQKRLNSYNWKNLIAEKTTSDVATLSDLRLNGHKKVVIVKPGEQIKGEVICSLDRPNCSALSKYRIVLGIKDQKGQTTIYNHLGLRANEEKNNFVLTAPKERGIYQVGFQVVKSPLETTALKSWEEKGAEVPTIGLIVVN